ncbi:hypothetical protein A3C57_03075 [Candidatus Nomurabacteria bacterium RIFCSPHIGHO2_02_FULL_33_12]|nr:MAG: hypothetical protein A3C57_03075 [Candidatus Nomurabacteria bacterium RIFCSPHIGHO2_02_FULL_33_12]
MFNEQNPGLNKDVAEQKTDMGQVNEMATEALKNASTESEAKVDTRKTYDDGRGGITELMTPQEHADYLNNNRHNA